MNINDMEAWRAVTATGTTQGAARVLGISQSAVSRRIAQLEARLGVSLFLREHARLVPTRANHRLSAHLSELLESCYRLNDVARQVRKGNDIAEPLRLAMPHSLSRRIMPGLIAAFLKEHHQARFEIFNGSYFDIRRMIVDKSADVGLLRLPETSDGIALAPSFQAASVCILPIDHPLAKKELIHVRDLSGVPLVLLGRRRMPRNDIDLVFTNAGVRQNVRIEAHSVGSACGLVAQGIGVSIVNSLMLNDLGPLPIVARPFRPDLPHHFAFGHATDTKTELVRKWLEFAHGYLARIADRAIPLSISAKVGR